MFRKLTPSEIEILKAQHCHTNNWTAITVTDNFIPSCIHHVTFSGNNTIGCSTGKIRTLANGLTLTTGIANVHLHNCMIGDEVCVYNIRQQISHYNIDDHAVVYDCGLVAVTEESTFAQGIEVSCINENGGREVPLCDQLTSPIAYTIAFFPADEVFVGTLKRAIHQYANDYRSHIGNIDEGTEIVGCNEIRNLNVGTYAQLYNNISLCTGTIRSTQQRPCRIADGVIAHEFIAMPGAEISEGANIQRCFVGESCTISKAYSATNSLFFDNSELLNGEACSIFAGPHTVSHHRNTLLIAANYSFFNAGSGSNQSNHMYRLGAVHQGVTERGVKFASNSYILWPAYFGAFCTIKGRHLTHPDLSNMPFSIVMEQHGQLTLLPGYNLKNIGTYRDMMKWPQRDKRNPETMLGQLSYNSFNPAVMYRVENACYELILLQKEQPQHVSSYQYQGYNIPKEALEEGIRLYNFIIAKYIANGFVEFLKHHSTEELYLQLMACANSQTLTEYWHDYGGMPLSTTLFDKIKHVIVKGDLPLNKIVECFKRIYPNTNDIINHQFTMYINWLICRLLDSDELDSNDPSHNISGQEVVDNIIYIFTLAIESNNYIYNALERDITKEFAPEMRTGYLVGTESRLIDINPIEGSNDFVHVRGTIQEQSILQQLNNMFEEENRQFLAAADIINKGCQPHASY